MAGDCLGRRFTGEAGAWTMWTEAWLVFGGLIARLLNFALGLVSLVEYMGEPMAVVFSLLASLSLLDGVSMSPVGTSVWSKGWGFLSCDSSSVLCGDGVICSVSCLAVLVAGVSPGAWLGLACELVRFLVSSCLSFACLSSEIVGD